MDISTIIGRLNPIQIKVLETLESTSKLEEIQKKSGLKQIQVMRGLQWLANDKLIEIKEIIEDMVELGANGIKYIEKGLPEIRFLKSLVVGNQTIKEIVTDTGLEKDEISVCLGLLRSKLAIQITKGDDLIVSITNNGKKMIQKPSLEEHFLSKAFPLNLSNLLNEERLACDNLMKRKKILKRDPKKIIWAELTDLGRQAIKVGLSQKDQVEAVTPDLLKTKKWQDKKFRHYNVEINVPKIYGGRRHFVNEVIEYVKRIWLDLGFKEMTGGMVQSSFWNFDALFTAQDHPVRDMQDTFFINSPEFANLPDRRIVSNVSKTHQNGGNTNSIGWGYKWDAKESLKNVLRTHTTVLSVHTLSKLTKKDLPVKFFSVGRVFRNETLDWKHLFEFHQTDCIVVDPNANFSHLIGYLREFFSKMGYPKVRVRPAYFPYTEPSAEVDVFHPIRKEWIELGGAGIFRPEVVIPLVGTDIPVLAWGLGLERIVTEYYNISDLREIYSNDLKQLRQVKAWVK